MHDIEPYSNWRHVYTSEHDANSPFYERTYNEFEYTQTVYNYYIHPQWDYIESPNLYLKLLMVDYEEHYAIIELIGEWNDAIDNDIMTLRREVTDKLYQAGITQYILITENILNFHSSDDSYYEDWIEQLFDDSGWVTLLNLPIQSQHDFKQAKLHHYIEMLEVHNWRTYKPFHLYKLIKSTIENRLTL